MYNLLCGYARSSKQCRFEGKHVTFGVIVVSVLQPLMGLSLCAHKLNSNYSNCLTWLMKISHYPSLSLINLLLVNFVDGDGYMGKKL